jgi:omega-6 fatty acid desaturase (delta-12 desaturase)
MAKLPQLKEAKTTTLNPWDIVACFKLKVWDPGTNTMVGLKEVYYEQPAISAITAS